MILLLSKSKFELTTEEVIDWLVYFKQSFKRINGDEEINIYENFDDVKTVWFRRWLIENSVHNTFDANTCQNSLILNDNIRSENKIKAEYFFHKLKDKKWLSNPLNTTVNKLIVLDLAEKIGLKVPPYKLISKKRELLKFKSQQKRIITKSIANPLPLNNIDATILFYTKEINKELIENLKKTFPISFFQKLIEKEFEIRVFIINKKFFSMAIFNNKENIDYREKVHSTRKVPFQLPRQLEEKLKSLIIELNLITASIDLIYGKDKAFYFLEVNPIGQIGMVSDACNYHLEKEIAMYLKEENENIH